MTDKTYQHTFIDPTMQLAIPQHNQNTPQHCLSYPPTNATTSGTNQCDSTCTSQGTYRYQNIQSSSATNFYTTNMQSAYCDQLDSWINESRLIADIEKGLKFPEKIETIEITSKDLSPASCCSNVDLLLPDFYKGTGKDVNFFNKTTESQWYCGNQKYNEFSSCAQMNAPDKATRYCNVQRSEMENYNKNYYMNDTAYNKFISQQDFATPELYYDNRQLDGGDIQQYFCQPQTTCYDPPFNLMENVEQRTEASNDESDIIVEESDEDITDYSEDQEKNNDYIANCIVCNALYAPHGSQFYFLTSESPLTMSSQKPVLLKLTEFVGNTTLKRIYLCSQCLGLINTIDHLQFKLESCKREFYTKFENSCKKDSFKLPLEGEIKSKIRKVMCDRVRCKLCKNVLSFRKFYQYHLKRHKLKNRYLCEICGKRYTNIQNFKTHFRSHKKSTFVPKLKAFVCKLCNKPFRTRSNLKEHNNYCAGLLPFICKHSNCDKKFPTITKLKNHVKLKHDKKFSSICSICNIGFVKTSSYKAHMISHSTEKKYNCTKCDKSYKTLSNLNFHMKYHNEKLPFACDICGKGFMRKEYLEAHVNAHNGIKNFVCQVCDKKFVSQKNLDSHLKYHEGTVKTKTCGVCGKVLTTGFEEHMRTHNNLKEFECKECGKKFNTKGALMKHRKNKHSDNIND